MKKIIIMMMLCFSQVSFSKSVGNEITEPQIYQVFDITNDKVLEAKNENKIHSIASLTKLMTTYTFIKNYRGNLHNCVGVITDDDDDELKHTTTRIEKNRTISCHDLLLLMMLVSDNYAASALAGSIPGLTRDDFYDLMNKEAQKLGMKNTYYKDSSGLEFENKSTANDLLKLIKVSLENETIKNLSSQYAAQMKVNGKIILFKNSNKLIRENLYDAELSKTGYIKESGYNLIFIPKKMCDNRNIAIIMMGASSSNNRALFAEKILEKYHCEKK